MAAPSRGPEPPEREAALKARGAGRTREPGFGVWLAAVTALVATAAVPRWLALGDDFGIDEIWSLGFAGAMQGPLDVLFDAGLKHDNNHPLNTLWLFWLGPRESWVAYRVPAFLAGLAAVVLAIRAGARRSRLEGVVAGLVFATSYLMVASSTEARGYSLAVACALAALLVFERAIERPTWRGCLGFWLLVTTGFLSHLSFGHAYAAFLAWSGWRVLRPGGSRRAATVGMLALHAAPLATLAAVYRVFVSGMTVGGGPAWSLEQVLSRTLAWTLGGPDAAVWALALGALASAVLAADALLLRRAGSDRWVFDTTAVLWAPTLAVVALQPGFLAPRYFLLPVTFFLLAWAHVLARLLAGRPLARLVGVALLSLSVAGNAAHIAPYLRLGKGEYAAALRYIVEHTEGEFVDVARYPDTASPMLLQFYAPRVPGGDRLRYFRHRRLPAGGVEWFVVNVQPGRPEPPVHLQLGDQAYELREKFGYSAPTGLAWWVYQRL